MWRSASRIMVSSIANYGYNTDPNDTTVPRRDSGAVPGVERDGCQQQSDLSDRLCNATLSFPRFALAAAGRLFIADGGNDRVLVFNTIPTQSGATADLVIGQIGRLR